MNIGDRVLLPCYYCNSDICTDSRGVIPRHARGYGSVTEIGKRLVTVKLEKPPARWRERGLSDHTRYRAERLRVVEAEPAVIEAES